VSSVDIISVTRNNLDGIRRTVESTAKIWKIAATEGMTVTQRVIDSSDQPVASEVAELVHSRDGNYQYVFQSPSGISAAFNMGINDSTADWIWMLNGGDELLPNAPLRLLFDILQRTGSEVVIFSGSNRGIRQHTPALAKLWPIVYCWIMHNATLVRRETMLEFGNYREDFKIAMDAELWIRMFGYYKRADVIDIPLINFEGGGISDDVLGRAPESVRMLWDNKRLLYSRMFDYPKICWEAWRSYRRNEKALRERTRSR